MQYFKLEPYDTDSWYSIKKKFWWWANYQNLQFYSKIWGPIYKTSYNLSHDYLNFIARSTYASDLQRGKISLGNIVKFTNTVSDDLVISPVNRI